MKFLSTICLLLAIVACDEKPAAKTGRDEIAILEAGNYVLDKTHASLSFRVNHLGISRYTMRFKRLDATLNFDPKNPKDAQVKAAIDPTSIETDFLSSQAGFKGDFSDDNDAAKARQKVHTTNLLMKKDFNTTIAGKDWLDAAQFPLITFTSHKIEMTSKVTATITGDLTMHGITKPISFEARFNGGYSPNDYDPFGSRIGFSAYGKIKRSDFGITYGIPKPGSALGISDELEVIMEMEFVKPVSKSAEK